MNYSRMARKLRKKISRFSGEVSKGLPKVGERFVREMVYGIQVSQSVVLTKIGRQLEERVSDQESGGVSVTAITAAWNGRESTGESIGDGVKAYRERNITDTGSKDVEGAAPISDTNNRQPQSYMCW